MSQSIDPNYNNQVIRPILELGKYWNDPPFRAINVEYNQLINRLNLVKNEIIEIEIPFCPENLINEEIASLNKITRELTVRANALNTKFTELMHQPNVLLDIIRPDMDMNLFLHQVRHMADTLASSHNTVQILMASKDNSQKYFFALKQSIAGVAIGLVSIVISILTFFLTQ